MIKFDDIDQKILDRRVEVYNRLWCPRVGDYVRFANGVLRQISYIWGYGFGFNNRNIQTSDNGSYYLGHGFINMSGSLSAGIPSISLILTDEKREGDVWFFHHNYSGAGIGVAAKMMFRVYRCHLKAPN